MPSLKNTKLNPDDDSSGLIDASSSLLSEHRYQRTIKFNLDPPSYSSVIADDSRRSSRNQDTRSSLVDSRNFPYTMGSDLDHEFNADVHYPSRLRSSMNSSSQPSYPTGSANTCDDENAAPRPTAPTYTPLTNQPPYPTESSNAMLQFKTDETSRPGSRVMPKPVGMEDISIISATAPYPKDRASGMPIPRPAAEFWAPIGFTDAVTMPDKSKSPTPKYRRSYESSTRTTESSIRSTPKSPWRSRNITGRYMMKHNQRGDPSALNVIWGICFILLLCGIFVVIIKGILVARGT